VASTSLAAGKHRAGIELFGDGLAMTLTEEELIADAGEGPRVTPAAGDAKVRVDRDFVDAVLGRRNGILAPYASALRTHRLACAITRSAEEGRAVELDA
jgi:predicted dehydrogenase